MIKNKSAFSLVELMVWILIVSIVMVSWFQTLSAIWVWKVKLIEKTKVEKEAYFAAEKFFEMIKKGWTIDYEEYWNRYSYNTAFTNGHFTNKSGFWNYGVNRTPPAATYGRRPYDCLSNIWSNMWTNGCLSNGSYNRRFLSTTGDDNSSSPQRYTQYYRQFIDRNSDEDSDVPNDRGDEDGNGNIVWDADDLHLWQWPEAFSWNRVTELYLIGEEGTQRTYFRWNVITDPDAPVSATCDFTDPERPTGDGCLWTIEFLKLSAFDYGFDHNPLTQPADDFQWDGVIDTWMIHTDFLTGSTDVIADSVNHDYWQSIFPNNISVSDVEFYIYPNKDTQLSWRDSNVALQVAPYLQLKMKLQPSWAEKRKIKWEIPEVDIATTIQLSSLNFR